MAKTIDDYKKDWAAANATGDKAGMDAAHAAAEALRAQAGYSGGADGSQYIPLANPTGGVPTTPTAPAPTMPSGFQGSATGVAAYTPDQATITKKMNENSQKWWTATPEEKERLHAENQQLAAQLGGSVAYNPSTGTWSGAAGYTSQESTQIDGLLNAILNRQPFSYDYKTDPAYLAYEDKYKRLGDRAREDTLGDVASLTGGMPSSWAVSAASQAQNDYNQQLSDVIPTLYDAAYNRYVTEDSMKRSDLGLVMDVDDMNYGRYRDTVGDAWKQKEFDYGVYRDNVGDSQWEKGFDQQQESIDWGVTVDKWNMKTDEEKTRFDNLMTKWQVMGVADEEVATGLGIPVGATTESYYFNKLSADRAAAKGAGDGGGGDDSFEDTKNKAIVINNAKKLIHGTSQGNYYDAAIEYVLENALDYGIDMEEFYSIFKELGASEDVIDKVYGNYVEEQRDAETPKDYLYYAGLMGSAGDVEAQAAWLDTNKYSIPDDIYEKLKKLLPGYEQ